MRIGFNPNKDQQKQQLDYYHQVIIPVHIPDFEGYYQQSFEILKLSLQSLFKTIHNKTFVTIVNNASCKEVVSYLDELFKQHKINELIHTDKIGKLNAIIKGLVGHQFSLITIVDADVLFINNWQNATYEVFENFNKVGAVCTTPSSRSLFTHTQNIWFDLFLSKKMEFTQTQNPEALKMFAKSVGDEQFYSEVQLKKYLTVSQNNTQAVVGAGHFMCTYRADIFKVLPKLYSNYALGGDSEATLLDIPVVKKDYWRLSTTENYTYHLGNVTEDWMYKKFDDIQEEASVLEKPKLSKNKKASFMVNMIKNKLFKKLFLRKKMRPYLMKIKGLTQEEVTNYKC